MNPAARLSNDRLQHTGFVGNGGIAGRTPFAGPAIPKQARGYATKPVVPGANDRLPCCAGTARSGHEHNGRPGPAFIVIDVSLRFLDHAKSPNFYDFSIG